MGGTEGDWGVRHLTKLHVRLRRAITDEFIPSHKAA